MITLKAYLKTLTPVSDSQLKGSLFYFQKGTLTKRTHLVKTGKVYRQSSLIQKGFLLMRGMPLALLLFLTPSCKSDETTKWRRQALEVWVEVLPEGGNYYSVSWEDTIGWRANHTQFNRPLELWCHILSTRNDTLGYYRGMSTPMTFAYFETTDSIVILQFAKAFNHFNDAFPSEEERKCFWERHKVPVEYEPVEINMNQQIGQKLNYELKVAGEFGVN